MSEDYARVPDEEEAEIDDALGLQLISIRLPKDLIHDLKVIAAFNGMGYQPVARQALQDFVTSTFRDMAKSAQEPSP